MEYDLTALAPLPFADGAVDLIYCSHVIEHVPNEVVANMFKEAFRVLKPGGGIRVACPDAALFLIAYENKDVEFLSRNIIPESRTDGGNLELLLMRQFCTPRRSGNADS